VQDSSVDNSYDADMSVTGTTTVTVDNTFVTNAGIRGGPSGDGIQVNARGSQHVDLSVTDSVFEVNIGDHVQVSATESSATNSTTLRRNLMTTSAAAAALGVVGGGVVVAGSGTDHTARSTFTIAANSIQGARTSAITISQSGSAAGASLRGTISQNIIGGTGADSCAVAGSSGVDIRNRDGAGTLVADVSSNTISQCSGPAISVRATGGPVATDLKVGANTIGQLNGAANQLAFLARLGNGVSDTSNNTCLDLVNTAQAATGVPSIVVQSHPSIGTRLVGYTSGSVPTFLSSRNSAIQASATGAYAPAPGTCLNP
jgi:hypothetical protein